MDDPSFFLLRGVDTLDALELGPDIADAFDDVWLDQDGELSAAPGWWWTQ
jgi:hypothetical protein